MIRGAVSIQFTGGKDSTLLAWLMANEFDRIELLTFSHPLVVDLEKVWVNVRKLRYAFGKEKFGLSVIDVAGLLRKIYYGNYWADLKKYKTYATNNFCGACRLAMISHTILHCLRNGIKHARDGSSATGFDLSQQSWALPRIRKFYGDFGIDYQTPIYDVPRADVDLLRLGIHADRPVLLYRSQPRCRGGGGFHNIYLRSYFLPIHGREAYQRIGSEWLDEKLELCRDHISEVSSV